MSQSHDGAGTITLAAAVGEGRTDVAAFDNALVRTGTANFNLIRLCPVIPAGASVVGLAAPHFAGTWGDRLYVVYAAQRASRAGDEAWAGIGWVQDPNTGMGLFVEHEGTNEHAVREEIAASLEDLQTSRGFTLGPPQSRVIGGVCTERPICALVICVYGSDPWPPTLSKEFASM
jgi:arginine decarboxylase